MTIHLKSVLASNRIVLRKRVPTLDDSLALCEAIAWEVEARAEVRKALAPIYQLLVIKNASAGRPTPVAARVVARLESTLGMGA